MYMISIVIIVKNDLGVAHTLQSLLELPQKDSFEILVVDASNGFLNHIQTTFPTVRWIPYHNMEKTITISEQRNLGIAKAKGSSIVFIDANCIPQPNWLEELSKPLAEHEHIIAGKVKPSDSNTINTIAASEIKKSLYLHEAPTINLLISKEVFQRIGTFDEQLTCGEDVDFCWRAVNAGYKIRYAPKAIVIHNYGSLKDWLRRAMNYGEARVYLYAKHKKSLAYLVHNNIDVIIFPILVLLLIASLKFYFLLIIFLLLILKNIQNHPVMRLILNMFFGIGVWKGLMLLPGKKL